MSKSHKQLKAESAVLRSQAVITLGTLGLRNKHIFRLLLEMLDLDPCKDVRVEVEEAMHGTNQNQPVCAPPSLLV
ncbi:hypothetical protein NDU88_008312 [Pleurodeles waltl]|uniref:Uncharacterized protein n=1 Tax=Pleurodeles waltl TaxID=8319 RepID=A0AAV7PRJ1_PLEWA|nr:hypothetical protein NDU88_008312 [Pleurodeles waltl]